jgi:hypothetical protein
MLNVLRTTARRRLRLDLLASFAVRRRFRELDE